MGCGASTAVTPEAETPATTVKAFKPGSALVCVCAHSGEGKSTLSAALTLLERGQTRVQLHSPAESPSQEAAAAQAPAPAPQRAAPLAPAAEAKRLVRGCAGRMHSRRPASGLNHPRPPLPPLRLRRGRLRCR